MLELFLCQFYFLTFLNLVSSILNIYSLSSKGFTCNNNQIIVHYFCSEYEFVKFNLHTPKTQNIMTWTKLIYIPQLLSPFMTLNKKKFCIQKASHTQSFDLLSQKPCPEQLFWQTENSKYQRLTWKIKHAYTATHCNVVSIQLTI